MALKKPTVRSKSGKDVTSKRTKQTPKKSSKSSSTKSGDAKLASFKESHSSDTSTPTVTQRSEAERKAHQLITSDVGRSKGQDRTKAALQTINNQGVKEVSKSSGNKSPSKFNYGGVTTRFLSKESIDKV